MDNSISININNGNNSMDSLSFHWTAILKDGTIIRQFNDDKTENRFKLVQDNITELAFFNLTNKNGKWFTVNVKEGMIGYNDLIMPYRKSDELKENVRLIYFRRHRIEMMINNVEKSHTIEYHLGFQYLNNGKNMKIILIIDELGNWYLGE